MAHGPIHKPTWIMTTPSVQPSHLTKLVRFLEPSRSIVMGSLHYAILAQQHDLVLLCESRM